MIRPATLAELETLTKAMPEWRQAMILLAAWCALRQGELLALRRDDIDLGRAVVSVRRAVVRVSGVDIVGTPKAESIRDVAIPPHLLPVIEAHLIHHVRPEADALLFPAQHGGYVSSGSIYRDYKRARLAAGRPDLTFHALRHTGATLAAATGATLADLMARLGHSTQQAAMLYQHTAADRDRAIADALSDMATGTVVPLAGKGSKRRKSTA